MQDRVTEAVIQNAASVGPSCIDRLTSATAMAAMTSRVTGPERALKGT